LQWVVMWTTPVRGNCHRWCLIMLTLAEFKDIHISLRDILPPSGYFASQKNPSWLINIPKKKNKKILNS
jgi:hypothetical protein